MSQIDKLTFIPHLFWFVVLFLIFYFLLFSYFLPFIYECLRVRSSFLFDLVNSTFFNYVFCYAFLYLDHDTFFFLSIFSLYRHLKSTYDFKCVMTSSIYASSKNVYYIG